MHQWWRLSLPRRGCEEMCSPLTGTLCRSMTGMCFAFSRVLAIFQFDIPTCFDSGWMLGRDPEFENHRAYRQFQHWEGTRWLDLLNQWVLSLSRSSSRRVDFTDISHRRALVQVTSAV